MIKEEPRKVSVGTQDNMEFGVLTKADKLEIKVHQLEKGKQN